MKKVYQITKFVVARSVKEAIKEESKVEITEIFLTKHSTNLLLDDLHSTPKEKGV